MDFVPHENQSKMDEILEIVRFLKDNMAMQADMDQRFDEVRTELTEIRRDISDIRTRISTLEKRSIEDDDAMASEIVELKSRVRTLEQKITALEGAHA